AVRTRADRARTARAVAPCIPASRNPLHPPGHRRRRLAPGVEAGNSAPRSQAQWESPAPNGGQDIAGGRREKARPVNIRVNETESTHSEHLLRKALRLHQIISSPDTPARTTCTGPADLRSDL